MSEELNEDKVPLPWNPNEQCELNEESVPTKKDDTEEQDGTLFNRECDDLDNTIVKRKDRFIDCVDIPDVPKAKLLKEDWPIVPFPGVPEVEIPKRLMAHLLSCCLKDRTAGFDFDITQELDGNSKAQISNWADENNPITTTVAIQLGTTGYLLIGLNLKPQLCFCDESCGDEDYIHITANLDAVYHDEIDDHIHEDPDLVITDDQLTKLVSEHGGGGGGNPLCSQKIFAQYDDGWFTPMSNYLSTGPVYSEDASSYLEYDDDVSIAPYLHNLTLTNGGIYKLEYFCEYNKWFVTDGECPEQASSYNPPKHHENVTEAGEISGEFDLSAYLGTEDAYTVQSGVSSESTLTEAAAFSSAPVFDMDLLVDHYNYLWYTATVNSNVSGVITYNIVVSSTTTNKVYSCKIVFHIDTVTEEEE